MNIIQELKVLLRKAKRTERKMVSREEKISLYIREIKELQSLKLLVETKQKTLLEKLTKENQEFVELLNTKENIVNSLKLIKE